MKYVVKNVQAAVYIGACENFKRRKEKKRSKAYCVSKLKWRITLYWRMEGVGVIDRVISHKSRSELAISVVQYSTDPFK